MPTDDDLPEADSRGAKIIRWCMSAILALFVAVLTSKMPTSAASFGLNVAWVGFAVIVATAFSVKLSRRSVYRPHQFRTPTVLLMGGVVIVSLASAAHRSWWLYRRVVDDATDAAVAGAGLIPAVLMALVMIGYTLHVYPWLNRVVRRDWAHVVWWGAASMYSLGVAAWSLSR